MSSDRDNSSHHSLSLQSSRAHSAQGRPGAPGPFPAVRLPRPWPGDGARRVRPGPLSPPPPPRPVLSHRRCWGRIGTEHGYEPEPRARAQRGPALPPATHHGGGRWGGDTRHYAPTGGHEGLAANLQTAAAARRSPPLPLPLSPRPSGPPCRRMAADGSPPHSPPPAQPPCRPRAGAERERGGAPARGAGAGGNRSSAPSRPRGVGPLPGAGLAGVRASGAGSSPPPAGRRCPPRAMKRAQLTAGARPGPPRGRLASGLGPGPGGLRHGGVGSMAWARQAGAGPGRPAQSSRAVPPPAHGSCSFFGCPGHEGPFMAARSLGAPFAGERPPAPSRPVPPPAHGRCSFFGCPVHEGPLTAAARSSSAQFAGERRVAVPSTPNASPGWTSVSWCGKGRAAKRLISWRLGISQRFVSKCACCALNR